MSEYSMYDPASQVREIKTLKAEVERLRAEKDKWITRFTEISAPGSLGAFAARDMMRDRIDAALAKVDEFHRRPATAADVDIHVTSRDLGRLVDAMIKALKGGAK